jgi:hypothetical protein
VIDALKAELLRRDVLQADETPTWSRSREDGVRTNTRPVH